jgi:hypothetical protein
MKNFKKYIVVIVILTTFVLPAVSLAGVTLLDLGNDSGGVAVSPTSVSSGTNTVANTVGCTLKTPTRLGELFNYVTCIISSSVIPLIFALALAMFVWGVVQYVINTQDEAKREKGKQFMIWGIIALTVMVCIWGLVAVLGNTFGINTGFIPQVKSQ